jgi:hypothetical protein
MMKMTAAVLGLILILATQSSATDWVVGPFGSGAPFNDIQTAVNAAQPGDRVLVLPGAYVGPVFINKAIELVGGGSSVVTVHGNISTFPGAVPAMRVTGVGAGSRARISGMTLNNLGVPIVPVEYILKVDACTGLVELSDLVLLGPTLSSIPMAAIGGILNVQNCSQVVISGVRSLGIGLSSSGGSSPVHGLSGAVVQSSMVWIADSTARGSATSLPIFGWGGDGGDGITLINSVAHIARSVIQGAQTSGLQNGVAGAGGPGIRAQGSTVVLHGGFENVTAGANAYEQLSSGILKLGTAGSGVILDGSSSLVYGVDVSLAGGTGTASLPPGTPLVAAAGSIVEARAERLPTVSVAPASAPLGSQLTIRLSGEPGVDYIRAVGLRTMPALGVGALGSVVIDLSTIFYWPVDTLDPTGNLTSFVTVPLDPSLAAVEVVEQCAQALPGGIVISPPVIFTFVL